MSISVTVSVTEYVNIIKGVYSWLTNLDKASEKRKKDSVDALRAVILAIRETESYLHRIQEEDGDHDSEKRLSSLWTDLSFKLRDLGITKLADKCFLKGKYWADSENYSTGSFNSQPVISLKMVEHIAKKHLSHIESSNN